MWATRGTYPGFHQNSTRPPGKSEIRKSRRSRQIWGLGLAALILAVACSSPTGPELVVEVRTPDGSLIPTAAPFLESTTGDDDICCCRVRGTVANLGTVPVHVTLQFEAFVDGDLESTGTAIDFIESLQAGAEQPYDAVGFVQPCSGIDRVELSDVDLRAVDPS